MSKLMIKKLETFTLIILKRGRHENIPSGASRDYELGKAIDEWVYFEFFDFSSKNDHLLRDYYDCSFKLEGNDTILEINIHEEDEYGETVYGDDEDPVFESHTVTLEEIELTIDSIDLNKD